MCVCVCVCYCCQARKTGYASYRVDAAREVAKAAEREQQMRVAARQQAMAHARAMARARNQSKVINQTRASFNAADAAAAAQAATVDARVTTEHSSPTRRPGSSTPSAPGSGSRGTQHSSNTSTPSHQADKSASKSAPAVDEAPGLLPADDSRGRGDGLTFVEELDLAAARLERMGGSFAAHGQEQECKGAQTRQQKPGGSHNSRDLSAPTAWELCIKNSELTMDEDQDQIGMGGTGTVYKALWCGAPVAVKKIYYGDDHDHDPVRLTRPPTCLLASKFISCVCMCLRACVPACLRVCVRVF